MSCTNTPNLKKMFPSALWTWMSRPYISNHIPALFLDKSPRSSSVVYQQMPLSLSTVPFSLQEHAHELNGVLISNRLAHAELLGTMEKQDFAFAVGIRRCAYQIRRRCLG